MVDQGYAEAEKQRQIQVRRLKAEQKRLRRERQHKRVRVRELAATVGSSKEPLPTLTNGLAELESTLGKIDSRLSQISQELTAIQKNSVDRSKLETVLAMFGPVWEDLYPGEKAKIVSLLIGRGRLDSASDKMAFTFR